MGKVDDPVSPAGPAGEGLTEAAASQADLAVAPELVANSLGEYVRVWFARVRGGESGVLPVVGGLLLVSIVFQSLNSHFLTAGNLVNLLVQGAVISILALGETYALLLGEIDLSIGFVSGFGGVIMAELLKTSVGWPWWAAIAAGLLACAAIGALQGTIITRIGLPSFVVTLAGLLFWQGAMLLVLGTGGALPINDHIFNDVASGNLTPIAGWVVMIVIVGLFGLMSWRRDARRRASGLVAPPPILTLIKIIAVFAAGAVLVVLCNTDRGNLIPIQGVPWVVLVIFAVLAAWTFVLGRTRFGRYVYAIGGNAEAARRAGVSLAKIRTIAFVLCSFTAGIAGVVYASRLRGVATSLDGGTLVLDAVAAAVIGGASLFGGRGKASHAVLGALVIAAIANGMGLMGYSAAAQYMVTAVVLLLAVTIDALARRGRVAGT
jgi:ABC-type xylose transport system permease subunit